MIKFCAVLILLVAFFNSSGQTADFEQIKHAVVQWAPLIWMSPNEKYYPGSVENFLKNVQLTDGNGKLIMLSMNETQFPIIKTETLHLVTISKLDELHKKMKSFLNGCNPKANSVPTYVIISPCVAKKSSNTFPNDVKKVETQLFFSATYWFFYPYNYGKNVCFLGNIPTLSLFGSCFGHTKAIGSHVGDWEHMTLLFKGTPFPTDMYLSSHYTGVYYKFDATQRYFKQKVLSKNKLKKHKPPHIVRLQRGHPVVFAANGSHGLWPSPGEHDYIKFPRLVDKCGYGVPWKTWKNLKIFILGQNKLPTWMHFKGRWGNPKSNCVLSERLGLCEYTDGPPGILRNKQEFSC